jgi:N-formylglutamate amidohydrolase
LVDLNREAFAMSRVFVLLAFALPVFVALAPAPAADEPKPAKPDDFVTVQKGTLPIIISAPHGGKTKVPDVPERVGKGLTNFYTMRDEHTIELTEKFVAELEKLFGGKPWVVIARFERKYADVNRSREEGYENEKAKPYYDAYHDPLAAACKAVKEKFGRGLLLDIHGNANYPNQICRGTLNLKTVSLLKEREGMTAIRGTNSVLGRMEKLGYKVLPAGNSDEKTKEISQYAGGYIVSTYGSHTKYGIDAIQLEFGTALRDKEKIATTANDLADAVRTFHDAYLQDEKK